VHAHISVDWWIFFLALFTVLLEIIFMCTSPRFLHYSIFYQFIIEFMWVSMLSSRLVDCSCHGTDKSTSRNWSPTRVTNQPWLVLVLYSYINRTNIPNIYYIYVLEYKSCMKMTLGWWLHVGLQIGLKNISPSGLSHPRCTPCLKLANNSILFLVVQLIVISRCRSP
jgi:hypothetical protein